VGSGKRSLVFDTIFTGGYLQFFQSRHLDLPPHRSPLRRPVYDEMTNLPPVIRVDHRFFPDAPVTADLAGIYQDLIHLFLLDPERVCPRCGFVIKKYSIERIMQWLELFTGRKVGILFSFRGEITELINRGYYYHQTSEGPRRIGKGQNGREIQVLIDQLMIGPDIRARLAEGLEKSMARQRHWITLWMEDKLHHFPVDYYCPRCRRLYPPPREGFFGYRLVGKAGKKKVRYREGARYYRLLDRSLADLMAMSVEDLSRFLSRLGSEKGDSRRGQRVRRLQERIGDLQAHGLGQITGDRWIGDLSPGQRLYLKLLSLIDMKLNQMLILVDHLYHLHHPQDRIAGIRLLKNLRDRGNSIVLIEHDPAFLQGCDRVLVLGPGKGSAGGEVVFQGDFGKFGNNPHARSGECPDLVKGTKGSGREEGAAPADSLTIPRHRVTLLWGPAGSGKSRLLSQIARDRSVAPKKRHDLARWRSGLRETLMLANFLEVYAPLCRLMADQQESRIHHYLPADFSRFTARGRCARCRGRGWLTLAGGTLPTLESRCRACEGSGLRPGPDRVRVRGMTIEDILQTPIEALMKKMPDEGALQRGGVLEAMIARGLGYLALGRRLPRISPGALTEIYLLKRRQESPTDSLIVIDEVTFDLDETDCRRVGALIRELKEKKNTIVLADNTPKMIEFADKAVALDHRVGFPNPRYGGIKEVTGGEK